MPVARDSQMFQHIAEFVQSDYSLRVATKAECLYDLLPVTELTLSLLPKPWGTPSSLELTGDYLRETTN